MSKETLLALAARCKAADGPDRELDAEIARFLGWTQHSDEDDPVYHTRISLWWKMPGNEDWSTTNVVPFYTASIDAALTLVPEGWNWSLDYINGKAGAVFNNSPFAERALIAAAATPALALCSASLMAHAHASQEQE